MNDNNAENIISFKHNGEKFLQIKVDEFKSSDSVYKLLNNIDQFIDTSEYNGLIFLKNKVGIDKVINLIDKVDYFKKIDDLTNLMDKLNLN